ncbi:hypothetical protein ABK040_009874 [Willaertia magna]
MEILYFTKDNNKLQTLPLNNIPINDQIKLIKYGASHIIFLTVNNNIYVYGSNEYGELGNLQIKKTKTIEKLNYNFGLIKLIECGNYSTFIVNKENHLYFTGHYLFNKLSEFTRFNDITIMDIKFIRGSSFNNYFISDNKVYFIDLDLQKKQYFVEGIQIFENGIKDLQCGSKTILLDKQSFVYLLPDKEKEFKKVDLNFKVKQIACYNSGCLILNNFGEVFGMGDNNFGELGFDNIENDCFTQFTKLTIPENLNVKNIFTSFGDYNIIYTANNKFYATGLSSDEMFGIKQKDCKIGPAIMMDDFESFFIDKFTEVKLVSSEKKYIYLILNFTMVYFIKSGYPLLENENYLQPNCFQKFKNKQLLDIKIKLSN